MREYYDTRISDSVLNTLTRKRYRISVRKKVPYITYNRKTRVLFKTLTTGAYVNVGGTRVFFL